MIDWLLIPYYRIRRWLIKRGFIRALEAERIEAKFAEEFLEKLLNIMSLLFIIEPNFRKHIKDFFGTIEFRSKDYEIRVLATFKDNKLKIRELKPEEKLEDAPNAVIIFKNPIALMNFLLPKGGRRDILRSILNNEVVLQGNLNYIYRFSFIANHLQLALMKRSRLTFE
ncbi:TPA: hypothetical protein DCX16_05075 [bacterium]|nr:hypothetical protein [bacterium]